MNARDNPFLDLRFRFVFEMFSTVFLVTSLIYFHFLADRFLPIAACLGGVITWSTSPSCGTLS